MPSNPASRARQRPDPLRTSTLVKIAIAFIVGIAAVVWLCYISFKPSVMAFDSTNAPGALATPPPTRPPPPAGPVRPNPMPTQEQDGIPAIIPTAPRIVTPAPNTPNGPPPPDG
jgi:hypothetical protein